MTAASDAVGRRHDTIGRSARPWARERLETVDGELVLTGLDPTAGDSPVILVVELGREAAG